VNLRFTPHGWADYQYWIESDTALLARVNVLIEDTRRSAFKGLGKPEPLRGQLSGWWSRRITGEHRLVYRAGGQRGNDQYVEIAACRFHY
jgi:toxin YoeB